MLEPGLKQQSINIGYFEGVNGLVSFNIGKKTEFVHAENARSKIIGTIEKREGQTVLGTNTNNQPFVTTANYGIFSFQNNIGKGFYRISATEDSNLSINVQENICLKDIYMGADTPFQISVEDTIVLRDSYATSYSSGAAATIYYINSSNQWVPLSGDGTNITGGIFDYTYAEGHTFLVNKNSDNRYISANGTTVVTSASGSGHLYNTPPASRINYYKNRLYLADFIRSGINYKTTVLRSSYPMGIIALLNQDYSSAVSGTAIDVTDTKYFYNTAGANVYDIYRGQTLISTITVSTVNSTSVVATWAGTPNFLSSDEVWVSGTYSGEKVFRWVNNPTVTGQDIQQYDTFKLSGGENEEITMLTNIGNVMLISNKSTIASWNDYTLENFDLDIGCVSKKGYVKAMGVLYFLHYTGVFSTSGAAPVIISNKVEKYINGATKTGKENCAAGKKGRNVFFTLGDVTLYKNDGSVDKILKDTCLEYNVVQQNWYVHKNVKASEFATFIEETDSDRLEFTDTSGNHSVKEFLSGETDDGKEIDFRIDTMKVSLQSGTSSSASSAASAAYPFFERSSNPIAVAVESERGAAVQVFANLENGEEFYPLEGTVVKGLSVVKITNKDENRGKPPICRLISFSFRDSSKQICKLSRMNIIYVPTTDEIPDNSS